MSHCRLSLNGLLVEITMVLSVFTVPLYGQESGTLNYFTSSEESLWLTRWESSDAYTQKLISEEFGEVGSTRMAQDRGWTRVLGPADKGTHRQGFDQVWKDDRGCLHILESKGGDSRLRMGYGEKQGTLEWAIKAAEDTLESNSANELEKKIAQNVLQKATSGDVEIHTVHTTFKNKQLVTKVTTAKSTAQSMEMAESTLNSIKSLGTISNKSYDVKPYQPSSCSSTSNSSGYNSSSKPVSSSSVEQAASSCETSKTASKVATVSKSASSVAKCAKVVSTGLKIIGVAAVAVDMGTRVFQAGEITQQYKSGEIDAAECNKAHIKNVAGAAGGYSGAAAGGWIGAATGAAVGSVVPVVGTTIGGFIGGVVGGIGGYIGGERAANAAVDACYD